MLEQATSSATPPPGKPKGWNPNPNSMLEQLECHAHFVSVVDPSKASWNLDSWRPAVAWWIEVFDLCNVPANGQPILPLSALSPQSPPGSLPLLPPAPFQPIAQLPLLGGTGHLETTGGVTRTWTNYASAGGTEGPSIPSNATVQVACVVQGFRVADGNVWWYKIESSPWGGSFYASADAFYNNGATFGSLAGTPFVDPAVPSCTGAQPPPPNPPPPLPPPAGPGYAETTGGVTHTWTNYTNAGGTEGPSIPSNATVQVACAVQGFRVADGNTWWYKIASSPWSGSFYASADAFYNNGATSGSLKGTPFVDPAVPACSSASIARAGGATERGASKADGLRVTVRSGSIILSGQTASKRSLLELDVSRRHCESFARMRNRHMVFGAFYVSGAQRFEVTLPSQALMAGAGTHVCGFLLTTARRHVVVRARG